MKIKIRRVLKDDRDSMLLSLNAVKVGTIPEDGFIINLDCPTSHPLYLRESDILKAQGLGSGGEMVAESWGDISFKAGVDP